MITWLSKHKFQAHLTVFLMMVLASIGMLFPINLDSAGAIWILLVIFGIANLLAMVIK